MPDPTISGVVVAVNKGVITWNAAASRGVASSSITIDGVSVTTIDGPYTCPPGVNYAAVYGAISSGSHTYVITATDGAGNWSQRTGTFATPGPTISGVVVSLKQGIITWNAAASAGVATPVSQSTAPR